VPQQAGDVGTHAARSMPVYGGIFPVMPAVKQHVCILYVPCLNIVPVVVSESQVGKSGTLQGVGAHCLDMSQGVFHIVLLL